MYSNVRRYTGIDPGTLQEVERRRADIEAIFETVPGFVGYLLFKTGDGIASVTVCDDRAGAEESNRLVAEWIGGQTPPGSCPARRPPGRRARDRAFPQGGAGTRPARPALVGPLWGRQRRRGDGLELLRRDPVAERQSGEVLERLRSGLQGQGGE